MGEDRARWRRVWEQRPALLRLARRRTASREDAEDAVHEALLRAAQTPHISDEHLGAWLTTVTVRLCVDAHRRRQREERAWARAAPLRAVEGFEEGLCDQAEAAWLARPAADLPLRQAEALHLRASGLTIAQLAQRLGTSPKAVESLLGRARSAFKARWAGTLVALAVVWRGVIRGLRSAGTGPVLAASAAAMALLVHNADQSPTPAGPAVSAAARGPASPSAQWMLPQSPSPAVSAVRADGLQGHWAGRPLAVRPPTVYAPSSPSAQASIGSVPVLPLPQLSGMPVALPTNPSEAVPAPGGVLRGLGLHDVRDASVPRLSRTHDAGLLNRYRGVRPAAA